jgi:hypothetical protein
MERVAVGRAVAELRHPEVQVELGQEVLLREGRGAARVAHLVARLQEVEAVLEGALGEDLHRLDVVGGDVSGRTSASGCRGSEGDRPRRVRNRSSSESSDASARTIDSWACEACSSARYTSSLLDQADLEAGGGGAAQALAAVQALPRHRPAAAAAG